MLTVVVGVGFVMSPLAAATLSGTMDVSLTNEGNGEYKPDYKPGEKPTGEGGNTSQGGSDDTTVLTGVLTLNSGTNTLNGLETGGTLTSSSSDENVILVQTNAELTISHYTLTKDGDSSSEDNSNFFALNAVVAAKTAGKVYIDSSVLNSNAKGANCLFASGSNSTIYAYNCTITSTNSSSRGLDATYGGTVIASKMTIDTASEHCASLATDRGNGYISATDSTLSTAGNGSPLIYSTGIIEVNGVTGTATGAQIAGIEGLSKIRIRNSNLSGSAEKASESVPNGVMIYQSNSGDSAEGTATFEVSDSILTSTITGGALFYITHSAAFITVKNTDLAYDSNSNWLLKGAGNNEHNWGTPGSNGAEVVFTAIDQTLFGNVSIDGISSLDLYLTNSTYTGTFINDTTYTGDGDGIELFISADSTWTVTSNCTLKSLTVAPGAKIVDSDENVVSIVQDAETKVSGDSALTITVSDYVSGTFATTNVTPFEIDRTAFNARYGIVQSEEDAGGDSGGTTGGDSGGSSGGVQDHNNWTNYFKPHPPDNAIVKVKVAGATEYGTPDRDHKYCLDGYWDGGPDGIDVWILYVTNAGYLFSDGGTSNTWSVTITNNAQEVYPPDDVVTVKAKANSGSTDYLTLKAAIDAAQARAKITLADNVTLDETLVITNSITLDLNTNVVTLGSALTNAFHFKAGGTVSNGMIKASCTANLEDSVLLRFTDCKATLRNLTINGRGYESVVLHDSETALATKYESKKIDDTVTCEDLTITGNGCLLSVDYAKATLTNNCTFTSDGTFASFGGLHEAAISCTGNGSVTIADGTYAAPKVLQSGDLGGQITVNGGTFSGQIYSWMAVGAHAELEQNAKYRAQFAFAAGDYTNAAIAFAYADARSLDAFTKADGVEITIPSGYAWVNNVLTNGPLTAGVTSEPYCDAISATNAAEAINASKESSIVVPTGVEGTAKTTYLNKVAATVTGANCVVIDLTPAAQIEEQAIVDAAVTSETVAAALTSSDTGAIATITATTPGLYYWIKGGTDVASVTEAGPAKLSTTGGSVELTKPTLDATKGRAFFRIATGVNSPAD